jgi:ketosteroid isomerase-like protein
MTAHPASPLTAASIPSAADRDVLFKTFGRAWFKRDVDLLFQAVTPDFEWRFGDSGDGRAAIAGREAVAAEFAAMASGGRKVRFADVVYHHAPEATFMTFRIIETDPATGAETEFVGVERYTFRDGRIAVKDVYRKRG